MKQLAGTLFVYNAKSQDYCYIEAIKCLQEFCDGVIIVDAGSIDGTKNILQSIADIKTEKIIYLSGEEWESQHGKEKLNYFTNIAIKKAQDYGYEYQFNLQADEIVHEKSYDSIRKAIETGGEGFMCNRINLWASPFLQLNVSADRLPCSSKIIRLAKTKYRSVGDAESIGVDNVNMDFTDKIDIWHYGFVRDKKIMKQKVIHIQEQIFGVDHDKKLDGSDEFIPSRWFGTEDLRPIDYPHPRLMKDWISSRP